MAPSLTKRQLARCACAVEFRASQRLQSNQERRPRSEGGPLGSGYDAVLEEIDSDGRLAEIVLAGCRPRPLLGGVNRRQQQRDQDADDGNHDEQFDERESAARRRSASEASCSA